MVILRYGAPMIQSEMNQLIRLNSKLLGSQALGRFREQSVYCTARSGQKITFTPPSEIVGTLAMVLEEFNSLIAGSESVEEISFAMSYFWMGFIATHPFLNGNGRTAKAYLEQKAKSQRPTPDHDRLPLRIRRTRPARDIRVGQVVVQPGPVDALAAGLGGGGAGGGGSGAHGRGGRG